MSLKYGVLMNKNSKLQVHEGVYSEQNELDPELVLNNAPFVHITSHGACPVYN